MAHSDATSQQLSYFKAPSSDDNYRRTITDRIRELADEAPDKVAFVFRSPNQLRSFLTRQNFLDKVTKLGLHFVRLGIKPGNKVAIIMPSGEYFLIVQFGLYMAGAVAVNSLQQNENELIDLASILGCTAKVVQKQDSPETISIRLSLRQNLSGYGLDFDLISLLQNAVPKDVALPVVPAEARAVLLLTSGSTGAPKLVTHTHLSLLFGSFSYTNRVSYRDSDIIVNERPMHWIGGYPLVYLGVGATAVYAIPEMGKPVDETFFVDVVASERATSSLMMEYRLNAISAEPYLSSKILLMRNIVMGGERIKAKNVETILMLCEEAKILYASTESISFSGATYRDSQSFEDGTVGIFSRGTEAKIVSDEGVIVPVGEVGELHVRSDGSSKEYVNLDGSSKDTLDADNWYHTGDMALMKSDGTVITKGRKTETIKRSTFKISPAVIEKKLQEQLDIQEVAVVGVPGQRLWEEVCACIILKPGSILTLEYIKKRAEEIFKPSLALDGLGLMPGYFLILDKFPRTISGKCSRPQLAKEATAILQSRV